MLDEPTNDLDIESLELLEATLQQYDGTLLLVSHDRAFLDNVVTQTLVSEGNGVWREYVGGYSDWLRQRPDKGVEISSKPDSTSAQPAPARASRVKLSFKEKRDLTALPAEIEALENEQREITGRMSQCGLSPVKHRSNQGGPEARRTNRAPDCIQVRAMVCA